MMSLFTGHALSLSARPTFARPPNKHSLRVLLDLRPRAFGGGNNAEAFSHANAAVAELRAKKDTDDLPVAIERAAEVGRRFGINALNQEWNEGLWDGLPLQGRLKEVFKKELSLPAVSFGVFTEPQGALEVLQSVVIKGRAGGFSDNPHFYAVRSDIRITSADGKVLDGVNTVMGFFKVYEDDPTKLSVTFDRVALEGLGGGGGGGGGASQREERRLATPATVDQWLLLMMPDLHVTRSSLGSYALLTRHAAPAAAAAGGG